MAEAPTPPLRSSSEPWGLSDLTEKEQVSVDISNKLMRFTIDVIKAAIRLGVPVALENPATSIMWCIPELQALYRKGGSEIVTDFCQWGTAWRKSTKVWYWSVDLSCTAKRCTGKQVCSRTNQPHETLSGLNPAGQWKTKAAEAYPSRLTNQLAKCCVASATLCRSRPKPTPAEHA